MKRINVTGWYGIYLEKKKLVVTIGSSVKVYSEDFHCIKVFRTIKYPFMTDYDKKQSKLYIITTENLVYCIDLNLLEIVEKHRILLEREFDFEIGGCKLLDYDRTLFFLIQEQGRGIFAVKYNLESQEAKVLFSNKLSKYSFNQTNLQYSNSELILLENSYYTRFASDGEGSVSKEFFFERQCLNEEPKVMLCKIRSEENKPITVLDISEEGDFYLIEEPNDKITLLDDSFNRIFKIEKTMIGDARLKSNPQNKLLAITIFNASEGNMFLLKIENNVVKKMRKERAYDCIFRENDVVLLADRRQGKLCTYEELFF